MTSYTEKGPKPPVTYHGFDHLTMWVGNAKQASSYYCTRFGFHHIGYRGLETGHRDICSHVVRCGSVDLVFQSPLNPNNEEMSKHAALHGDGVRDVAFCVDDARACWKMVLAKGGKSIRDPWEESDKDGTVVMASVATYGDTIHTFVERKNYKGKFLPNYAPLPYTDPLESVLTPTNLLRIDHCVGNQPDLQMVPACAIYEKQFGFHRFWSVDDKQMHTQYSALRSIVMADYDHVIKMPINEPAEGKKKSQIQEYVEYYGGAGVQHVALRVANIIESVRALRSRGVQFLVIPPTYYENLRIRLQTSNIKVKESLDVLQELQILVDYDDEGYLLQIFTAPVEDRPTLFWEIIQREKCEGFGAGNFKSLFEAIELEQGKRGNL